MAITRFQDLPSTETAINLANLNGNFDELGANLRLIFDYIPTESSEDDEK